MRLKLANNTALPTLPVWQARSFWIQLLALVAVALNVVGIDLYAMTCSMGLGCNAAAVQATGERVVAAWQMVLPFVLGIWAWVERRAPRYRLMWPWNRGTAAALILATCLLMLPPGPAQAAQCAPRAAAEELLADQYSDAVESTGPAAMPPTCSLTLPPSAAQAGQCASRMVVQELLADRFGEAVESSGAAANGVTMEVWASPVTGTWTITVTNANGVTCLLTSGDGYSDTSPQPEGDPT